MGNAVDTQWKTPVCARVRNTLYFLLLTLLYSSHFLTFYTNLTFYLFFLLRGPAVDRSSATRRQSTFRFRLLLLPLQSLLPLLLATSPGVRLAVRPHTGWLRRYVRASTDPSSRSSCVRHRWLRQWPSDYRQGYPESRTEAQGRAWFHSDSGVGIRVGVLDKMAASKH